MIETLLFSDVEFCIKEIAQKEILSRFGDANSFEMFEKNPGDIVTTVDLTVEKQLSKELVKIIPESLLVGEEMIHAYPEGLFDFLSKKAIWLVDPLDGTANFINGSPDFTVMVALIQGCCTLASWIYAPVFDSMAFAVLGKGAFVDGERVNITKPGKELEKSIVVTHPDYRSREDNRLLHFLNEEGYDLHPSRGAGLEYTGLVKGLKQTIIFTWEKPWDHAAGLLLHSEAGGANGTLSRNDFSLLGGNDLPIIATSDRDSLERFRLMIRKLNGT